MPADTEKMLDELAALVRKISEQVPIKQDAYVAFSFDKKAFYVSTTDKDELDGYVTMDDIVNLFIENHEQGQGGNIQKEVGDCFASELERAARAIRARTES